MKYDFENTEIIFRYAAGGRQGGQQLTTLFQRIGSLNTDELPPKDQEKYHFWIWLLLFSYGIDPRSVFSGKSPKKVFVINFYGPGQERVASSENQEEIVAIHVYLPRQEFGLHEVIQDIKEFGSLRETKELRRWLRLAALLGVVLLPLQSAEVE